MDNLAGLSCCKREGSRLGCVIIRADFTEVVAIGYNGPAAGEPNDRCRGADAVGSCGCIHAEANAITKMGRRGYETVLICSLSPCEHCAGLIINTQCIKGVIFNKYYRDVGGIDRLRAAGITTVASAEVIRAAEGFPG